MKLFKMNHLVACAMTLAVCTFGAEAQVKAKAVTGAPGTNAKAKVSKDGKRFTFTIPSGAQGDVGPQGLQGVAGPQGDVGPQGLQGVAGPQGDVGPQGLQGVAGPQGDVGPQGVAGPQGDVGPQGPQGLAGPAGPAGADGATGLQGPQGFTGAQGPQGEKGDSGSVVYTPVLSQGANNLPPIDNTVIINFGNGVVLARDGTRGGLEFNVVSPTTSRFVWAIQEQNSGTINANASAIPNLTNAPFTQSLSTNTTTNFVRLIVGDPASKSSYIVIELFRDPADTNDTYIGTMAFQDPQ